MPSTIQLEGQTKIFTAMIQNLSAFTPNIRITAYPDKCIMDALNESHTSITNISLTKEWFSEYSMDNTITLIVNTNILYKIINVLDDKYPITLTISTNDLIVKGKSIHSEVTYTIPSLNIDIPEIDVPNDIEYAADISMNSKTLCSILDNLLIIGDDCLLHIEEDSMTVSSSGDYGTSKIDLTLDDLNGFAVEENINLQSNYQLKLLHSVSLYHKAADIVDLHVGDNTPLVIQYNMEHESYIKFMIAPKIDDN